MKKTGIVAILMIICVMMIVLISYFCVRLDNKVFYKDENSVQNSRIKKHRLPKMHLKSKTEENQNPEFFEEEYKDVEFVMRNLDESIFKLNDREREIISDYVSNWSGQIGKYDHKSEIFKEIKIIPENQSAIPVNLAEPVVYCFSPEKQGMYRVFYCAENGAEKAYEGYIAVFDEKAQLMDSTDSNYGTGQSLNLQFSTNEVYYIVMGRFLQNDRELSSCFSILQNAKN